MKITRTAKILWSLVVLLLIANELRMFIQMKRTHVNLFHSTYERVLAGLLIAIMLIGVVVESRTKRL